MKQIQGALTIAGISFPITISLDIPDNIVQEPVSRKMRTGKIKKQMVKPPSLKFLYSKWTEEENSYMKDHYGKVSAFTVAKKLGRTPASIHTRAKKMGLTRPRKAGSANA